jgi:membrane associated rhomboid family serine protease
MHITKNVKGLIIANAIIFILELLLPLNSLVIDPDNLHAYQFITYMFLHASVAHIFFNMFALFLFGPEIENWLGSEKFLKIYLISGVISGISHILFIDEPVVGASGSVWSIMVMYALLKPNQIFNLYFIIPVRIKILVSIMFLFEIYAAIFSNDSTSHFGHIGGALAGFIFYQLNKKVV